MSDQVITAISRAEVEDFLYHEAALLDEWHLDEWLELLTEDASYYVPSNDVPYGDHKKTLFLIADDIERLKSRVKRLKSRHAHAENPKSRTKRMIQNVRITERSGDTIQVTANFVIYRFRRNEQIREYVGTYHYQLVAGDGCLKIRERRAVIASEELGTLGNVSILL